MMRAGALSWCLAELGSFPDFLLLRVQVLPGGSRPTPDANLVLDARRGTLSPRAFILLMGTYGLSQRNQHPLLGSCPGNGQQMTFGRRMLQVLIYLRLLQSPLNSAEAAKIHGAAKNRTAVMADL